MDGRLEQHLFNEIDQLQEHLLTQEIEPIQLSAGRLNLGFASLAFEDTAITRLDCNRKVSDRFHMDPSWLLLVVLLAPQRWAAHLAPAESLVVIAPDTEYRTSVPEGFRCVEVAIRLDLADQLGLGGLCRLKGAQAIIPLATAATQRAEHRANRLLGAAATKGVTAIGGERAAILREGCLEFVCFLRDTGFSVTQGETVSATTSDDAHFALAQNALQVIETSPIQEPPSVEALAKALCTTRRTLLAAFQEIFGTSPSRYMLARRLNSARYELSCGERHSVTDAALDLGFEHFGRFSNHYRTLFDEMPSETLRRTRILSSAASG